MRIIFGIYGNITLIQTMLKIYARCFFPSVKIHAFKFYEFIKLVKISKDYQHVKNTRYTVDPSSITFYKRNLMLYVIVKYHNRTVENDENPRFEFTFTKIAIISDFTSAICSVKKIAACDF